MTRDELERLDRDLDTDYVCRACGGLTNDECKRLIAALRTSWAREEKLRGALSALVYIDWEDAGYKALATTQEMTLAALEQGIDQEAKDGEG